MVAGCRPEAHIDIAANGATPEFVVSYDRGKKACVWGLTVTDLVEGKRRDVWAVRRIYRAPESLCRHRFTYGVTPVGYELLVKPEPLRRARAYEVSSTGGGWGATEPLTI